MFATPPCPLSHLPPVSSLQILLDFGILGVIQLKGKCTNWENDYKKTKTFGQDSSFCSGSYGIIKCCSSGKDVFWAPVRMHTHPRPAEPSAGRGSCLPVLDWAPKWERTILHCWHCSPLMSPHAETGQGGCKTAFSSEFWWGSLSPVIHFGLHPMKDSVQVHFSVPIICRWMLQVPFYTMDLHSLKIIWKSFHTSVDLLILEALNPCILQPPTFQGYYVN